MTVVNYSLLQGQLRHSRVFTPSDGEAYNARLKRWSTASELPAAAVALPESDEDVSTMVRFASEHKIEIAVVGGGNAASGSSSVKGGMTIDLSLMRAVHVDPVARTALVQGGARWSDVDAATVPHGLACVAGTVDFVGVAGSTLGGGWGILSGYHGLMLDNITYVIVVLADGRIVKASKDENADLFWAMRGAGPSFGIVVKFCLQAHPIPDHATVGSLVFPMEKLDAVVDSINDYLENLIDPRCGMGLTLTAPPPRNVPVVATYMWMLGTQAQFDEKYSKFLALQPIANTVVEVPYDKLNSAQNANFARGPSRAMSATSASFPLSKPLIHMIRDKFSSFIQEYQGKYECSVVVFIVPSQKVAEVPVAETSTPVRRMGSSKSLAIGVSTQWYDESNAVAGFEFARDLAREIQTKGNRDNSEFFAHPNLAYVESDSRKLFGVNYKRLVELKRRYDPQNIFHRWHEFMGGADKKEFKPYQE